MTKLLNAIAYLFIMFVLTITLGPIGFLLGILAIWSASKSLEAAEKKKAEDRKHQEMLEAIKLAQK